MKKTSILFGLLILLVLLSGCGLFDTKVTFTIGVVNSNVIYTYFPDYTYKTVSVTIDDTTLYPGDYEEVECVIPYSDINKQITIVYNKTSNDTQETTQNTTTYNLYDDDGEYVCVLGLHGRQFGSLTEMNKYLSDGGFPAFGGGGGGSSDPVCGTSYAGPDSDPQRDSFCQAAYAYRCLSGFSLNSTEVQTQCQLYAAMGGTNCPYCK